jgi:hypothetical protein
VLGKARFANPLLGEIKSGSMLNYLQRFSIFAFLFLFWSIPSRGQQLDTINIHKRIIGIHYKKCLKIWFCHRSNKAFSYNILTKQDDYISNDTAYYFKVFGFGHRLILEGKKNEWGDLVGPVTYYYRNGRIKQTEFYNDPTESNKPDSLEICSGDCPKEVGTWTYYDKKGRKTKTIVHQVERSDSTQNFCWTSTVTLFDKKGNIASTEKQIGCCEQVNPQ